MFDGAALAGYAAGARPVQAQSYALPFPVGDTVTFNFSRTAPGSVELRRYVARSPDAAIRPGHRRLDTEIVSRISSG